MYLEYIHYLTVYLWLALGVSLVAMGSRRMSFSIITRSLVVLFAPIVFLISLILSIYYAKEKNT